MRRLPTLVVLATLAVGCGANEATAPRPAVETTAAPLPAVTKPTRTAAEEANPKATVEFVAAANEICKRMQRDSTAVASSAKPSDAELAELVDAWRWGVEELAALDPPQERIAQFEQMVAHYRNMARAFDAMIEAEDETVLGAVAAGVVEGQRGARAARKAGLRTCALFPEIKQPAPDPQDLYEATRDLVPSRARITRDGELDCTARESCLIEYELDGSIEARMHRARALLRAHGWKNIRSGRMPTGGRWVMADRNDFAATLDFVTDKLPEHCGGTVTYGCTDNVWVHRVEVPEVLTGG